MVGEEGGEGGKGGEGRRERGREGGRERGRVERGRSGRDRKYLRDMSCQLCTFNHPNSSLVELIYQELVDILCRDDVDMLISP